MFKKLSPILFSLLLSACASSLRYTRSKDHISNPITGGFYADPTIVKSGKVFYIYATLDPWGGNELGVLETTDFKNFKQDHLNWPTKKSCTSPTSRNTMVWAPSVRKVLNGKYYMYVAVGGEIWAGVSDTPLGPWKNAKADNSPLIRSTDFPNVHNIDADCFIDTDGKAYLYWGSGYGWINGHCMAVKLKDDMISFDGKAIEVTPPQYFEAPHMIKRRGKYYLMFSYGKAVDATYKVGYAIGDTPLGPFTRGKNNPILSTTPDNTTIGPGHNTVFTENSQDYILYHRIYPQHEKYVLRQLCIDSLKFDQQGEMQKIRPTGVSNFTSSR